MTWLRNPFTSSKSSSGRGRFSESENQMLNHGEAGVVEEKTPGSSEDDALLAPRTPTERFSMHQILYITVMHGIGALIISGGINFAIAYGMYTTQDVNAHPIRLFELPNTLAGDAVVTIIIQSIVTWLVELIVVTGDIRNGKLAPIGFIAPPTNRVLRWFMFLDAQERAAKPGSISHWPRFLASQALRGFLIAVVGFILMWGPSVGILTAVGTKDGGDWDFATKWAPEVFKLILGGVLGLLITPPMAMFWMIRAGWPVGGKTQG